MTNINLNQLLGEDADYIDDNSAAALEGLPAASWAALVEACEELTGGEDPGVDCTVARTSETLADFDNSRKTHWAEHGSRSEFTFGGYSAVKYERFQLFKGQQRQNQIIIDLGDYRAALLD